MGLLGIFLRNEKGGLDDQYNRTATVVYDAAFTTDCDLTYVRLNTGFAINDPFPTDLGSTITNIDCEMEGERQVISSYTNPLTGDVTDTACYWWTITLTYGPWNPLEHTITGNPVDQPIDFSFQWQVFEQACDFAYDPGTTNILPVINSAGDPFDPPVTREQLKGVMRVAWNSLTFDPVTFFTYGNYINSDTWNGFPQYTIKFSPPNMPQRLYSQFLGRNYYRLEAEFCFNPNDGGWNPKPIDRGFRALNGSGVPVKIFDINAQPVSQPALLDGSGNVLVDPTGDNIVLHNFQVYNSIEFSSVFSNLNNLFT